MTLTCPPRNCVPNADDVRLLCRCTSHPLNRPLQAEIPMTLPSSSRRPRAHRPQNCSPRTTKVRRPTPHPLHSATSQRRFPPCRPSIRTTRHQYRRRRRRRCLPWRRNSKQLASCKSRCVISCSRLRTIRGRRMPSCLGTLSTGRVMSTLEKGGKYNVYV